MWDFSVTMAEGLARSWLGDTQTFSHSERFMSQNLVLLLIVRRRELVLRSTFCAYMHTSKLHPLFVWEAPSCRISWWVTWIPISSPCKRCVSNTNTWRPWRGRCTSTPGCSALSFVCCTIPRSVQQDCILQTAFSKIWEVCSTCSSSSSQGRPISFATYNVQMHAAAYYFLRNYYLS